MAMSSKTSQAWMTSCRVGGTRTRREPSPSPSTAVVRHMRDSRDATFSADSLEQNNRAFAANLYGLLYFYLTSISEYL